MIGPKALKPYAPVRALARREPAGVRLSWIRRGRRDADSWEPFDIPLGEDSESYAVEILSGETVKRRLIFTQPQALYAAADEASDFGGEQTYLTLRLMQRSAVAGDGFALETVTPVF